MTIEQPDVVDFVSVNAAGSAVLSISDHLPWDDVNKHLFCLQTKLNAYLRLIESGEIYRKFPQCGGLPIVISVVLRFPAPDQTQWFFAKVGSAIENAGFELEIRKISN